MNSENGNVSRSAFKVALGGFFGLVAGLISQVVIAWLFGAGAVMDAYLTALVVPLYLSSVLITGLSFVFVPTFIREEAAGSDERAWALVGTVLYLTGAVLLVVAIAGSLYSQKIIELIAPGLSPDKANLATRMLAILMFTVPLDGLGSLTRGIQNARNRFFWPAAANAFAAFGNILTLLILYKIVGPTALAWGYLMYIAIQANFAIVPVLSHGWSRLEPITDKRVLEMARLVLPFIFFGLFTRSTQIFERFFASGLPDGDLSYLGYANKISSILLPILASGIAAAIFPAMARAYTSNGERGLGEEAEYGFRLTLASGMPAIAILGAVAIPLVTVLYERGAFEHKDTLSVAQIVLIVMVGNVLFRMLLNIVERIFYVLKDTITVPMISAISVLLYFFLGRNLAITYGYKGLAFAKPMQMGLVVFIVFLILVIKIRVVNSKRVFGYLLLYGFASLIAALCAWMVTQALIFQPPLLQLIASFAVAGPVYMMILYWRDREMASAVLEIAGIPQIISLIQTGYKNLATMKG